MREGRKLSVETQKYVSSIAVGVFVIALLTTNQAFAIIPVSVDASVDLVPLGAIAGIISHQMLANHERD